MSVQRPAPPSLLPDTIAGCHRLIGELAQSQQILLARLAELEERLKLNSRNSSKPPSSDGPGGRDGQHKKPSSDRKRGAQPGHKGSSRCMAAESELDQIVECMPAQNCPCGGILLPHGKPVRHQVFELPKLKPLITEYRCHGGRCTLCGQYQRATLPPGVPSGQLGPAVLALIGTLSGHGQVTQHKMKTLLADVFGFHFSVGCLSAAHGIVAEALAPSTAELKQALFRAPVVHMDETSHQSHGHLMWNWALVTHWGACFQIAPSRGKAVAQTLFGNAPKQVLVSDRYAAYHWVDPAQRQVCWAHLLRDFRRIGQRDGLPGILGRSLFRMGNLLFRYHHAKAEAAQYRHLQARMRRTLQSAADQTCCSRTAKTCRNLLQLWPALWHFVANPEVPPTNNLAERALRGVVLRRKISYVTRSGRGLRFVERVYGAAYTCCQQGKSLFGFLNASITAHFSATPPPSLLPAA